MDSTYKRVGPLKRLRRATKRLRAPSKRVLFPWIVPIAGTIVGGALRMTVSSGRCVWVETPAARTMRESLKPFIFVSFHGRQFPLLPYIFAVPMVVLTSLSDLGWFEACFLKVFGADSERGSTTRGGARALIQLRRRLDEGRVVTISVDGPKGPQECVKAGAIFLARKTGIPLVPAAAAFHPAIRLRRSWDRSFVPIPFSRLSIVIGDPISVRDDGGDEVIAEEQARVRTILIGLGDRADRVALEGPGGEPDAGPHPGRTPGRT